MKPRGELERGIYAAMFAVVLRDMHGRGYPEAWRQADRERGVPAGSAERLEEWESWCTCVAIENAEMAVELHRKETRR